MDLAGNLRDLEIYTEGPGRGRKEDANQGGDQDLEDIESLGGSGDSEEEPTMLQSLYLDISIVMMCLDRTTTLFRERQASRDQHRGRRDELSQIDGSRDD